MSRGTTTRKKKKQRRSRSGHAGDNHGGFATTIDIAVDGAPADREEEIFDHSELEWSAHLALSKSPKAVNNLLGASSSCYLWGTSSMPIDDESRERVRQLTGKIKKRHRAKLDESAQQWIETSFKRAPVPGFALECLAWATVLSQHADAFTPAVWSLHLDKLIELASFDHRASTYQDAWGSQLFFGELPVTLAYLFPAEQGCTALAARGCNFVSDSLIELLDGAGMPSTAHLEFMRAWLACWTRCMWVTENLKAGLGHITRAAEEQFDWFVRNCLRLTRADRTHAFAPSGSRWTDDDHELFSAAVRWIDDAEERTLAKLIVDHQPVRENRLPLHPEYHSEWGGVAVLQGEWDPQAPRLVVAYGEGPVRAELSQRGHVLMSGHWTPKLRVDATTISVPNDWQATCWFSDHDVDFLELETKLADGWTLQRQFLLARQDAFLWLADVLLGDQEADLEYDAHLPLGSNIRFAQAAESFEGMLVLGRTGSAKVAATPGCDTVGSKKKDKPLAMVCPPALPEWRMDCRMGTLQPGPAGVRVQYHRRGKAIYVPVFIDLHRRRFKQPVTWRQLTVAERLEIVPPDIAVGYRVHVGPEQWMVYRSLTNGGNRTILGQNYTTEFVCGRFLHTGEVEPLIEIELESS